MGKWRGSRSGSADCPSSPPPTPSSTQAQHPLPKASALARPAGLPAPRRQPGWSPSPLCLSVETSLPSLPTLHVLKRLMLLCAAFSSQQFSLSSVSLPISAGLAEFPAPRTILTHGGFQCLWEEPGNQPHLVLPQVCKLLFFLQNLVLPGPSGTLGFTLVSACGLGGCSSHGLNRAGSAGCWHKQVLMPCAYGAWSGLCLGGLWGGEVTRELEELRSPGQPSWSLVDKTLPSPEY